MSHHWLRAVIVVASVVLVAPAPAIAGDAYVKLGITMSPDLGDFSDRWFFSGGSDWGFRPQAFWGIEFQGAYRSDEQGGVKVTQVPANVLFNLKWKSEEEALRPYAGAGVGLISSYVRVEGLGMDDNEWVKDAGFQLMGGVELNRSFVVELLGQRSFDERAEWFWSVLFGLRF